MSRNQSQQKTGVRYQVSAAFPLLGERVRVRADFISEQESEIRNQKSVLTPDSRQVSRISQSDLNLPRNHWPRVAFPLLGERARVRADVSGPELRIPHSAFRTPLIHSSTNPFIQLLLRSLCYLLLKLPSPGGEGQGEGGLSQRSSKSSGVSSFSIQPLAFSLFLFAFPLHAASPTLNTDFETANRLYEQSKFKDAADAYQKLVDRKIESPTIYFNLGNAWYKAGQNGRAIAAYLQAERLAPRDPYVRFNLNFVRGKVNVGTVGAGTLVQRALRRLSVNEWTLLATAALWIALFLLATGEARADWRSSLRRYSAFAALVAACLIAATTSAVYDRNHIKPAVVIVPEAVVHYGPLDESKPFYNLHDGSEVRLIPDNAQGGWVRVEDASGRQGWLKRDQIVAAAKQS